MSEQENPVHASFLAKVSAETHLHLTVPEVR
jgi:hypothetical protein